MFNLKNINDLVVETIKKEESSPSFRLVFRICHMQL